jgi:hypothetical protein
MDFAEVEELLREEAVSDSISDVTGGGRPNRASFLLTSYAAVETADGFTNNFVYPA